MPPTPAAAPVAPAKSTASRTVAIALVATLVGLGVGYVIGMSGTATGPVLLGSNDACYADATKKLMDAGLIEPERETRTLTGTITAISGDTLTLDVPPLLRNPLIAATPAVRRVTVPKGMLVTMRTPRSIEDFQKALTEFNSTITAEPSADATTILPPTPFVDVASSFSELTVGMSVVVEAAGDILRAESIVATSIVASPAATPQGVPPQAVEAQP